MKRMMMLMTWAVCGACCLAAEPPQKPLEQKMRSLMLPKVEFREASITDVVTFLNDTSRELDPAKKGVNFVLKLPAGQTGENAPKITLNLRQVPLYDLLRYTTDIAGLSFRAEQNAVVIAPPGMLPTGQMVTRGYRISPAALPLLLPQGQPVQNVTPPGVPLPPPAP